MAALPARAKEVSAPGTAPRTKTAYADDTSLMNRLPGGNACGLAAWSMAESLVEENTSAASAVMLRRRRGGSVSKRE
jgi:hypothetical protein